MRLLLVIPSIVSYDFLRELCCDLVADGMEVHLACAAETMWGKAHAVEDDGVRRHDIKFARGMNPVHHLRAARELDRLVTRLQPDLVHVHFSAAIFTTALARTRRWPKTIATFHGVCFPAMQGWKAALLRVMETWATRRLDAVWVLTDDDRETLQAAAPSADVRRLAGFGLGCDLDQFTPPGEGERAALRAKFGIGHDEVVFIFVGRFVAFKGFGTAIGAFLRLAAGEPKVRLLLVGARDGLHPTGLTPSEEQGMKDCPQIVDLGFRSDVRECLIVADLMIFPSRREGMSVCLMEALATGLPAITADSRGCRDVVRDEIDGRVIVEPTVEHFCEAITRAVESRGLREQWSAAAVAGRERFDRRRFIAEQKQIYRDCVPAPGSIATPRSGSRLGDLRVLLGNACKRLRKEGVRRTLGLGVARVVSLVRSVLEDRRRGVVTAGEVRDRDLGIKDLRNHWYVATDYETFHRAMQQVRIRPGEDVFVDFGSGKGRAVLLAAEHAFRRIIGVEFSESLHEVARENVRAALPRLRCRDVELVHTDATQWKVPAEATVLFFFNPFDGEVLARVCANIRQSLAEAPRKITLIYVRPDKFFEKEIAWQEWLTRKLELPCLEGKVTIYESKVGDPVPEELAGVGSAAGASFPAE
jgi:glycosyltransferase involved in cell wall biosynthesis/SAM-dependent methyltransferase